MWDGCPTQDMRRGRAAQGKQSSSGTDVSGWGGGEGRQHGGNTEPMGQTSQIRQEVEASSTVRGANKRGQQCNTAYAREQSLGDGARGKPGYTLAEEPGSGSPAPRTREDAGRGGWRPMANGPTDREAHKGGSGGGCRA